ncbi:MAG: glycosyltransferase family 2 protein, partial [Chlamydiae bacterium]|nr:glycosyltransferase family 2 protein [Chlamydiota bacterium]
MGTNITNLDANALVVIPAFNEEKNLPITLRRIRGVLPSVPIVVINDCSNDGTLSFLRDAVNQDQNLVALTHSINQGYGVGIQTGYKFALANGFEFVIQLDADGQHDPAYIPAL